MAVSTNSVAIQWSAADSVSVSTSSNATSDAASFSAAAFSALIQLKADNDGTPGSGDTVDFYALYTVGDPDAEPEIGDEYDTSEHAEHLVTLDTNSEDPSLSTVNLLVAKGIKIYAVNNSSSNTITVSGRIHEKTSST